MNFISHKGLKAAQEGQARPPGPEPAQASVDAGRVSVEPSRPAPLPPLGTLEEIHSALGAIDVQRLAAQKILDTEQEVEAQLLDVDASDQEFLRLAMRTRNARRLLTRLDKQEREVLASAQALDEIRHTQIWRRLVERYSDAAERLAVAATEAQRLFVAAQDIAREAAQIFQGSMGEPIPSVNVPMLWPALFAPTEIARGVAAAPTPATIRRNLLGPTQMIVFVRSYGAYKAGTAASVPAERARWLCQHGYAEPETYNPFGVPPPPLVPRPHPIPVSEARAQGVE